MLSSSSLKVGKSVGVCLNHANNSARIEELRIANENSEKIIFFRLARG
jgi:cell envelope opacity-associated protein A